MITSSIQILMFLQQESLLWLQTIMIFLRERLECTKIYTGKCVVVKSNSAYADSKWCPKGMVSLSFSNWKSQGSGKKKNLIPQLLNSVDYGFSIIRYDVNLGLLDIF